MWPVQSFIFKHHWQQFSVGNFNSNVINKWWCIVRCTSFFNKLPAEDLWRGVISVSNAGKKRGRGKGTGKKMARDLNKGQIIGFGKKNVVWPGLNAPNIRGFELMQQQKLPADPEREGKILKIRDSIGGFKIVKINPIVRGWSGAKMPGRNIGEPDSIGNENFKDFDTFILENKVVFIMKGNMGRKRRYSVLSVTGNKNGLAGFAIAKAPELRSAIRKSKNQAGQKLMSIDLCHNRTVFHDFYCSFGKTRIYVSKKPDGYGLVCHRAIQTIAKVLGIKDLYAKIEGSTNVQHIVKAIFIGLSQQKTYKTIAEEKMLHLVKFCGEQYGYPQVISSPTICKKNYQIKRDETLDFTHHTLGNRIILTKKMFPPFYFNTKGHELYLEKQEIIRNQDKVRMDVLINKGNFNV